MRKRRCHPFFPPVFAAASVLGGACEDSSAGDHSPPSPGSDGHTESGEPSDGSTGETAGEPGDGELRACRFPPDNPTRLVVTTTDLATGAISVARVADRTLDADVGLGTTDAIPYATPDRVYVVHRFGYDRIDVFDPEDWSLVGEFVVHADDTASANPHSITIGSDGLGYVVINAAPEVQIFDFASSPTDSRVGTISLAPLADADGNGEASLSIGCGDFLFVSVQRLDPAFEPVDREVLAVIDTRKRALVDTDPGEDGVQGIPLQGHFARQIRRDSSDVEGVTGLVLTTGIERVDFATHRVEWAVDEQVFVAAGFSNPRLQIQSFDLHGDMVYFAVYTSDFSEVKLLRTALSGGPLEEIAAGLNAFEKTLEVIGDELWFGDTTLGASGLRVYDLSQDPPAEIAGPLSTGRPPYSVVGLP